MTMTPRSVTRTLDVYRRDADAYVAHWARRRYRVPPLLSELMSAIPRGARVLDLGCGPGQDTRYLASRGFDPVGLDAVRPFLEWARAQRRKTRLVQGDILDLPFRPHSFSAAWAAASLIHLSKREASRVLGELRAIITPGGRLAATFVHGTASGVLTRGWLPGRYFSRWTKAELAAVVTRAGWEIESLVTVTNRERRGRWLNLVARTKTA
jgi:SAM-dependent methyltransferase